MRHGLLLLLVLSSPCQAQSLVSSNGNPTGPASALSDWYLLYDPYNEVHVTLYQFNVQTMADNTGIRGPVDLVSADNVPWVSILNKIGYHRVIQFETADGYYQLGTYLAWAEHIPFVQQGLWQRGPEDKSGFGGVEMGVSYNPNIKDFPKWQYWIQAVRTNALAFTLPSYARPVRLGGTGDWYYIDSPTGATTGEPFYSGGGATANYRNFLDTPNGPLNTFTVGEYTILYTFKAYEPDPDTLVISHFGLCWGYIAQ